MLQVKVGKCQTSDARNSLASTYYHVDRNSLLKNAVLARKHCSHRTIKTDNTSFLPGHQKGQIVWCQPERRKGGYGGREGDSLRDEKAHHKAQRPSVVCDPQGVIFICRDKRKNHTLHKTGSPPGQDMTWKMWDPLTSEELQGLVQNEVQQLVIPFQGALHYKHHGNKRSIR
jgi:hypothetical protein